MPKSFLKNSLQSDDSDNVIDFQKYKERALKEKQSRNTDDDNTDSECSVCEQTEGIIPEIIQMLTGILKEILLKK